MRPPLYLALSIAVSACARHEPGSTESDDRRWMEHPACCASGHGSGCESRRASGSRRTQTFAESPYEAGRFLAWSAAARALAHLPRWEERDTGYQRRSVLELATYLPLAQNLEILGPQPLSTIEQCRPLVDPPTPALEMFWRLPEERLLRWDDADDEASTEDEARRRCAALASTEAVFDAAAELTDRLASVLDNHLELEACYDGIEDDIVALKPGCQALKGAIDVVDRFLEEDLDPRVREDVRPVRSCSGLGSYVPRPDCPLGAEDIWQVHAYREGLAWVRATLPSEVMRERERLGCEASTGAL